MPSENFVLVSAILAVLLIVQTVMVYRWKKVGQYWRKTCDDLNGRFLEFARDNADLTLKISGLRNKSMMQQLWDQQSGWSQTTFGPDEVKGPVGALKHLQKEAQECIDSYDPTQPRGKQYSLKELADIGILFLDASRRAGYELWQVENAIADKQNENMDRLWNVPLVPDDEPGYHQK